MRERGERERRCLFFPQQKNEPPSEKYFANLDTGVHVRGARAWDSDAGKKASEQANSSSSKQPANQASQSLRCPRVHMCAGHEVALLVVRCVRAWLPSPPRAAGAALPSLRRLGGRRCRYACGRARRCHIDRASSPGSQPAKPPRAPPHLASLSLFLLFSVSFSTAPPPPPVTSFFLYRSSSFLLSIFILISFPLFPIFQHTPSPVTLFPDPPSLAGSRASLSVTRAPTTSKRCKAPRHLTDSALPTSSWIPRTLHALRIASRPMPDYAACPFDGHPKTLPYTSRALEQAGHLRTYHKLSLRLFLFSAYIVRVYPSTLPTALSRNLPLSPGASLVCKGVFFSLSAFLLFLFSLRPLPLAAAPTPRAFSCRNR